MLAIRFGSRLLSRNFLPALALAAFFPSVALATPIGSYTFKVKDNATAPDRAQVNITATAGNGMFFNSTFTVSGQDANQIRNTVNGALAGSGWTTTENGTNGIDITKVAIPPTGTFASPIKKVDGGSSSADVTVSLDGNVDVEKLVPGPDGKWKLGFAPGLFDSTADALALTLDLGVLGLFATEVDDTPAQAALDLFEFLVAQSFPDVELLAATNEVAFLHAPSLEEIGRIQEVFVAGPDLHLSLTLPSEVAVPEPATFGLAGLGLMSLLLASRRQSGKNSAGPNGTPLR